MKQLEIEGHVAGVLIAPDAESLVSVRQPSVTVTMEGFVGDRHSGLTRQSGVRETHLYKRGTEIKNSRQISIVSEEELREIAEGMNIESVLPELLGANLLLSRIRSLTDLPPSTRLLFPGDAALVVDSENSPCVHPGKVIAENNPGTEAAAFVKAAIGRRGLVAWVEREGEIYENDTVRVLIPPVKTYSIPPSSGDS